MLQNLENIDICGRQKVCKNFNIAENALKGNTCLCIRDVDLSYSGSGLILQAELEVRCVTQ